MGICTDGAASMTGKHSRAVACVREKVPNIIQMHWMIHREVLAAKHLGQSLCDVLSLCVKIVNSNKACPLQSQMFSKHCNELGFGTFKSFAPNRSSMAVARKNCKTCV